MKKYLTKFSTRAEYSAALENLDFPNVTYLSEDDELVFSQVKPEPETDWSKEYLTFLALEDGTFSLYKTSETGKTSYSLDEGDTWSEPAASLSTPTVTAGSKIMFKGTIGSRYGVPRAQIQSTGRFEAMGNPYSLYYGDDFAEVDALSEGKYPSNLFSDCTGLTSAENLVLPATTLAEHCYRSMFQGCTSLTTAPELPATTLANNCYSYMFNGCTSLTTAPELPATTLAEYCYQGMFNGCTSLTTAPELPATTLAEYCYQGMFQGCTSLTTAPELPATTLAENCYYNMFNGCTSLTTAPELPATTLANSCYRSMFNGCTSMVTAPELPATTLASACYNGMFANTNLLPDLSNIDFTDENTINSGVMVGLFSGTKITDADLARILPKNAQGKPCLPATTLASGCYQSMFNGCTSLTTAPELPATTLASGCYNGMFYGCTSLTTAPELPATTLAEYCYQSMFNGCTSLNYIKMLATDVSATKCLNNWVNGVSPTGTFVKHPNANLPSGESGIPTGWTVETATA